MENNEKITPGRHISFWLYNELPPQFSSLQKDMETDVVIVGGGIAGLSIAYNLLKAGKKVAVVEDGYIGSGETGHTTAHLTNALDDRYYHLKKLFGEKNLELIAQSHTQAIDFIEKVVNEEQIDCQFSRLNGYLFRDTTDSSDSIEKEYEAASKAGLAVELSAEVPGMIDKYGPCIEFQNQAQFHPFKYLKGLCKAVKDMGGEIFVETHAQKVSETGIETKDGFHIKAKDIVIATNAPINNKYHLYLKQFPYRTYVIGAKIRKGALPKALWWDTGDHDVNSAIPPYHYIRLEELDDEFDLLICGGEDHPTGLTNSDRIPEEGRYDLLENWMRHHFNTEEVIYRWSGQVMEPMDSLAYIGKNPTDADHTYIVTGDSGNGMTHATIAGMLITDLIMGKENPWAKIYDPSRVKWFNAGATFLKEFIGGAIEYLKIHPDTDPSQVNLLQKEEGKVLEWKGNKYGVYRDIDNSIHVVDAACTHMQCTVKWNNDEKSWDCPCHGSRFTQQGKVMNGPANKDLPYYSEPLDNEAIHFFELPHLHED